MSKMTIGEVARRAGLRTSALRYYESAGILPPAQRISGQRRYDQDALRRLAVIRLAQEAGLTISEIRALLHDFPADMPPHERWQAFAGPKLIEIEALI